MRFQVPDHGPCYRLLTANTRSLDEARFRTGSRFHVLLTGGTGQGVELAGSLDFITVTLQGLSRLK